MRLALVNRYFGDDVRFEGILCNSKDDPSIVTSQKFIVGDDPDMAEVHGFLKKSGFGKVRRELVRSRVVGNNTWYRARDGLLVLDAKPANFKKGRDGNLFPIDLPIRHFEETEYLSPGTSGGEAS